MPKFFKYISFMLVFTFTVLTCSGCRNVVGENEKPIPNVVLPTAPATVTYREMTEELYIGYLGVQKDFALIIDNLQYNYDNNKGGCANSDEVGCASMFTQLVMNYGLSSAQFTGNSSDKHVLVYYTTATEFMKFGKGNEDGNWLEFLAPTSTSDENADFNRSENVIRNSCGTGSDEKICQYANDLATRGFSPYVGHAMMLLFDNGNYSGLISDKMLDPYGTLDSGLDHDNVVTDRSSTTTIYKNYYESLVRNLKTKIRVKDSTANISTKAQKRKITQITVLSDLIDLIEGNGKYADIDDYLLLITTGGFIQEKVGNNYRYENIQHALEKAQEKGEMKNMNGGIEQTLNNIALLFNTITVYEDNCALENDEFINFLKSMLDKIAGVAIGAAAGAAIGAAVGSVIPFIGTGIGAVVGAVVGAILGWFAADKLKEALNDKNGITGDKYCKIMTAALNDFEINVPVYSYKVGSFLDSKDMKQNVTEGNLSKYRKGTMDPTLTEYYNENRTKCLTQNAMVSVPSGALSMFVTSMGQDYNYADACELEIVSNLVGGLSGSPTLMMFENRGRVDDLHGRATTTVIREILFTWGLTQLGTIYNLAMTNTLEHMGVTLGAAQKVNNLRYCISTSDVPSCDGLPTTSVTDNNYTSDAYVGTFDPTNGITFDFTQAYKNASNGLVRGQIHDLKSMTLDKNHTLYYKKTAEGAWAPWATIGSEQDLSEDILADMSNKLTDNEDKWYSIKYNDVSYLISDNAVIGYRVSIDTEGKISYLLDYYYDGAEEYLFTDKETMSPDSINGSYLTKQVMQNPGSVEVRNAHDSLYIYMPYDVIRETEDGNVTEEGIYTYVF